MYSIDVSVMFVSVPPIGLSMILPIVGVVPSRCVLELTMPSLISLMLLAIILMLMVPLCVILIKYADVQSSIKVLMTFDASEDGRALSDVLPR